MSSSDDGLASRLYALLVERGLSQAEVGRRAGIPGSTLNRIVHGKRQPNARELGALAHVLEIDLVELLGLAQVVSTLTGERDELARRLGEAVLAAEQAQRQGADEVKAANQARAMLLERTAELEAQLEELGRAQMAAQIEVERLRGELAAALGRIELLKVLNEQFPREQPTDRPEWMRVECDSEEVAVIRARHELERGQARLGGRLVGSAAEVVLLLLGSSWR